MTCDFLLLGRSRVQAQLVHSILPKGTLVIPYLYWATYALFAHFHPTPAEPLDSSANVACAAGIIKSMFKARHDQLASVCAKDCLNYLIALETCELLQPATRDHPSIAAFRGYIEPAISTFPRGVCWSVRDGFVEMKEGVSNGRVGNVQVC